MEIHVETASKSNKTSDVKTQTPKRDIKLTAKAFAWKLDKLQTDRKAKLNKASLIRKLIQDLMVKMTKHRLRKLLKN